MGDMLHGTGQASSHDHAVLRDLPSSFAGPNDADPAPRFALATFSRFSLRLFVVVLGHAWRAGPRKQHLQETLLRSKKVISSQCVAARAEVSGERTALMLEPKRARPSPRAFLALIVSNWSAMLDSAATSGSEVGPKSLTTSSMPLIATMGSFGCGFKTLTT